MKTTVSLAVLPSLFLSCDARNAFLTHFSQVFYADESPNSSYGRILRKTPSEEQPKVNALSATWKAAVSAESDSTATVDGKCRRSDGKVVRIGEHQGKGKGKGSSSKGKGKGSKSMGMGKGKGGCKSSSSSSSSKSCAPSAAPSGSPSASKNPSAQPSEEPSSTPTRSSEAPSSSPSVSVAPSPIPSFAPSATPTSCVGKGSMCMSMKSKKSKDRSSMEKSSSSMMKSKKSMKSSSSEDGKGKGNGKGLYEDIYIPACPEDPSIDDGLTHSPTDSPLDDSITESERCHDIANGTGNTEGEPTQTAGFFLALVSEDIITADLTDLITQIFRALLFLASGCDPNLLDRRQLTETSSNPSYAAVKDIVLLSENSDMCMAYSVEKEERQVCTLYNLLFDVYGGHIGNLEEACIEYKDEILELLEPSGVQSFTCLIPPGLLQPTPVPSMVPSLAPSVTAVPTAVPDDNEISPDVGSPSAGSPTAESPSAGSPSVGSPSVPAAINDGDLTRSSSNQERLSPGGFIGVTGGFLILILLLLLFVRRRKDKSKQVARHLEFTDDDEANSNFMDDPEDDLSEVQQGRLAHVVGEEDSQYTGVSWGNKSRGLRVERVKSVPEETFSGPIEVSADGIPYQDNSHHDIGQTCSSPSCKICESRRRQGAKTQFVRNQKYEPGPNPQRDYLSADTVDL